MLIAVLGGAAFVSARWASTSSTQSNDDFILHIVLSFDMVMVHVSFISCSLSFLTSRAPSLAVGFATWSSRGTMVGSSDAVMYLGCDKDQWR